ncbi:hypothetical protein MX747_29360, partial [Klebsiella pneumoniae]|nr:hypothetical protein [Klebsiella pneumoniae]
RGLGDVYKRQLMHHFDHIVASLCFERDGVSLPDFSRLFAGHKES